MGLHIPYFSILQTDKGLRSQIVTVVLIAGWSMVANLCALAGDWHFVRRVLPPRNWPAIFASPIVGIALLLGAFYGVRGFQPVLWLSAALPSSLAGAIAVCLVPLAMLWWSLDAMFRRVEFADKPARGAKRMIWQLIKRDQAWQWMPLTTLTVASSGVMWHFLALADPRGIATYLFEILFLFLIFSAPAAALAQHSETQFQSTMPITVRQVFLARMISMFSMLWVPVIAGVATLTAVRDPAVSGLPLKQWLAFTSAVLVIQCFAVRGVVISRRVIFLLGFLWTFGYFMRRELAEVSTPGTYLVAACCMIAGAIVIRTWRAVPLSFQDSPISPSQTSSAPTTAGNVERKRRSSTSLWMPLLQTLFRVPVLALARLSLVLLAGAEVHLCVPRIPMSRQSERRSDGWLRFQYPRGR